MKPQAPTSMRRIAQAAGVSHVTVSLALRNDVRLPVETRRRVQAVARELGYRPNPLIHALMSQVRARRPVKHTTTIAFLTGFPTADGWRKVSRVYRDYFDGAVERATQLGFRIEEVWAKEPEMTGRRLSEVLEARGIRGLLVGPVPPARGHLSLDWSRFASATMGYSVWRPDLHRASPNHYQSTTLALRELKRLGYKRIGLAVPRRVDERVNNAQLSAALAFQYRQHPLDRVPPLLVNGIWDEDQFAAWFREHRPHAVVAHASVVMKSIRRCGARVPDDVGFASLQRDDSRDTCAGIDTNAWIVGAAGVELVAAQLLQNEFGLPTDPRLLLIQGEWVDGDSTRRQ